MVNGSRHSTRRSVRRVFTAEPVDHSLSSLVVDIRQLFSPRKRFQVGPQIDQQLAIIAPLFLAVLPGLVPTGGFDTDKNAHHDYEEVERHREPVLGFGMLDYASENHAAPVLANLNCMLWKAGRTRNRI